MMIPFLLAVCLPCVGVPDGPHILVNGVVAPGEWRAAVSVPLGEHAELLAQKDSQSLFLAVVCPAPRHTGLDLYLESSGRRRMLHVSSTTGEREFQGGAWSDIVWCRNLWWTANPVCVFMVDGTQKVVGPEAFEFQLERSELGGEIALYVHLKRPEARFPAGATPDTSVDWIRLSLKDG